MVSSNSITRDIFDGNNFAKLCIKFPGHEHSSIYTSLRVNRFQLATGSKCHTITIVHLVVHNLDNSIRLKFEYRFQPLVISGLTNSLSWKKHKPKSSASGKYNHPYVHVLLVTGNISGVTEIVGHRFFKHPPIQFVRGKSGITGEMATPSIPYHKEGKDTHMMRDFRPGHFVSGNSIDHCCPFTDFVFTDSSFPFIDGGKECTPTDNIGFPVHVVPIIAIKDFDVYSLKSFCTQFGMLDLT
ncbi:hypothetical protein LPJ66_003288 [Kickxella alabastrina]|uniref:Uncharacterized protein n=1 Tax=Kickxella alabastrina TaxID=61397 RepID=A0ACC1IK96_9FUNG|nr:hypothetical protein LPJ66_003288 [Kickxella alabastrina]